MYNMRNCYVDPASQQRCQYLDLKQTKFNVPEETAHEGSGFLNPSIQSQFCSCKGKDHTNKAPLIKLIDDGPFFWIQRAGTASAGFEDKG